MIGLVMAGGKGTRMNMSEEKLVLQFKKPVILCVIDALIKSKCFSQIVAATSPNSPNTEKILLDYDVAILKTKGDDYVSDLNFALSKLNEPVFVVSGDLPLLDHSVIKEIVSRHQQNSSWQSFVVTKKFLDKHNLSLEFSINVNGILCFYTGISIVNPTQLSDNIDETHTVFDDKRIVFNLNTKQDYNLFKNS